MSKFTRIKGLLLLAYAFALIPMFITDAAGLQMDVIPSARIEEEWDSNVFNSSTNKVSSLATRVTPGLALMLTTTDNVEMRFSGNYEKVWYQNSEADRSNSETYHFRVESTGDIQFSPTFSMVPSVSYINTTDSFRRTQLAPSGDPVLPPVSITNYGNTKSETIGGGARFNYRASPNVTLGMDGNYNRQRFDSPVDNAVLGALTDSTTYGAGASVLYRFWPQTGLGVRLGGSRTTYQNNPDTETVSAQILFEHQFAATVRLEGSVGAQRVRRDAAPGTPEQTETSPAGTLTLTYRQETYEVTVYGSSVYSGGSGFGEATRQTTAGMRFTDRLAMDWSWNLSGEYQLSRSAFNTDTVDIRTINGKTGIQYRPWRWATVDLGANFSRQTSGGAFREDLDNFSAQLGFTASHPFNLF